jgi:hypothetical protein
LVWYQIHTGERAFVCPVVECAQAFARKTHLQHHVNSHHREIADMLPASSLAPIKVCGLWSGSVFTFTQFNMIFFFFFFCCKQRPIFVSGINQSSRSRKIAAATAGATNQYSAAAISNGKLAATGSGAQSTQDVMPTADAQPEHIISAAPVSASTPSPSAPSAEPVASDFVLAAAAVVAETNTRAPAGGTAAYVENAANSEHEVVSEPASTPSDMLMRLSTVATLSTQPSKAAEEAETGRRSARPQLVTPGLAKLLQTVPFAFTCILNLESCQSFCCFVLFFSFVCRPSK